ncbi:PfkB family carbohydrate kinase [Rubricoccus marinus]|uniref:Sugar kinase n=1 Tax=Rubricoccus marinus TaxID=716817 RepID=A0A259U0F7_9BACT|nr:PfkB family carbohydrate kinase [Rubricoccus marinus]OZC03461.1 sugar kinase [Rubricoccus marinus]
MSQIPPPASVLVVGTVAFDTIETPFGRAERVLGGSATYATLAARLLADPVRLCAVVGGDFPEAHVDALKSRGVDTEGLARDPDGETFFWAGRYHHDLNHRDTLATHLNVLATFEPEIPESYRDTRVLCLGNLDPTVQATVLDQVTGPDGSGPSLVIMDTMNYWIESAPEALRSTLARVDVLVINDAEARELGDTSNLVRAARIIREMGPQTLVIKKGEHGALLFTGDLDAPTLFSAPAYPLEEVTDPTGAGDVFMGGFAGHLARCGEISDEAFREAIVTGSAMASHCVGAFGPENMLSLTLDDVNARVQEFRDLSAIPMRLSA